MIDKWPAPRKEDVDRSIKLSKYEKRFDTKSQSEPQLKSHSKPDSQIHAVPALKALRRKSNDNVQSVRSIQPIASVQRDSENEDIDLHSNTHSAVHQNDHHSSSIPQSRVGQKRSFNEMGNDHITNPPNPVDAEDRISSGSPTKRMKMNPQSQDTAQAVPYNVSPSAATTAVIGSGESTKKKVRTKCKWG